MLHRAAIRKVGIQGYCVWPCWVLHYAPESFFVLQRPFSGMMFVSCRPEDISPQIKSGRGSGFAHRWHKLIQSETERRGTKYVLLLAVLDPEKMVPKYVGPCGLITASIITLS